MTIKNIFSWILRLAVAVILLQTLYFKFTAHPDSVHIFSLLGVEPWGRIGLGIVELITTVLILLPRTKFIGMAASFLIILGAVFSHILVLGINVSGDGGGLFGLALTIFGATLLYFVINKDELTTYINKIFKS